MARHSVSGRSVSGRWTFGAMALCSAWVAFGALPGSGGQAGARVLTTDVEIVLQPIETSEGVLRYEFCPAPDFGHDSCIADAVSPGTEGRKKLVLRDVAPGRYAFRAYHDLDGNGEFDMRAFGQTEPWGFSNNPRTTLRSPRFDEAAVDIKGGREEITVKLSGF